jgi:hypothetical protein
MQIKGEAKGEYLRERLSFKWLTNDGDVKEAFSCASNDTVFILESRRSGGASEISCDLAYIRSKIKRLERRLVGEVTEVPSFLRLKSYINLLFRILIYCYSSNNTGILYYY